MHQVLELRERLLEKCMESPQPWGIIVWMFSNLFAAFLLAIPFVMVIEFTKGWALLLLLGFIPYAFYKVFFTGGKDE